MRLSLRNVVLLLAIITFGSMVSGLTAYLHLSRADEAGHHDADHCSICHVVFAGVAKYLVEPPTSCLRTSERSEPIAQINTITVCQHVPATIAPRPPPTPTV